MNKYQTAGDVLLPQHVLTKQDSTRRGSGIKVGMGVMVMMAFALCVLSGSSVVKQATPAALWNGDEASEVYGAPEMSAPVMDETSKLGGARQSVKSLKAARRHYKQTLLQMKLKRLELRKIRNSANHWKGSMDRLKIQRSSNSRFGQHDDSGRFKCGKGMSRLKCKWAKRKARKTNYAKTCQKKPKRGRSLKAKLRLRRYIKRCSSYNLYLEWAKAKSLSSISTARANSKKVQLSRLVASAAKVQGDIKKAEAAAKAANERASKVDKKVETSEGRLSNAELVTGITWRAKQLAKDFKNAPASTTASNPKAEVSKA